MCALRDQIASTQFGYLDTRGPLLQLEALALLDAAIALRRLEEWMEPGGARALFAIHFLESHQGQFGVDLVNEGHGADGKAHDLLGAITTALDKAGAK
jgi:hypothetical protein